MDKWDEGEDILDVVKHGPAEGNPVVTKDLERGRWATKVNRNNLESSLLLGLSQINQGSVVRSRHGTSKTVSRDESDEAGGHGRCSKAHSKLNGMRREDLPM